MIKSLIFILVELMGQSDLMLVIDCNAESERQVYVGEEGKKEYLLQAVKNNMIR